MMRVSSLKRRLLVIDPGTRSIKFLVAHRRGDEVDVERHRILDLSESGNESPEELDRQVQSALQEFGTLPIAVTLPQQLSVSQVIDLPEVGSEQIEALIKDETVKLSGLSESGIVYDYGKLRPFGKYKNPFWVTFAQEEEILREASRLAGIGEQLCEIITPANALIAAYQSAQPALPENVVLVDLGASSTVVTIIVQRQGVYAINYPIGGDAFTETVAAQKNVTLKDATALKQQQNLLAGASDLPGLRLSMDAWYSELEKILQDWLRENGELKLALDSFRVLLSGGGARQPGLIEYLNARRRLPFALWPKFLGNSGELVMDRYAVAYGVALKSFGHFPPPASLFPVDLREARKRRETQEKLQKACWAMLLMVALVLLFATGQKVSLLNEKNARLHESQDILREAKEVEALSQQWEQAYARLFPVVQQRKRTVDTLTMLSEMQRTRGDKKLWYVLLADQQSYFAGKTVPPLRLASTNETVFSPAMSPAKYGFIAELSLSEEGEAMRQTLSKLVAELKSNPAFISVDTLPMGQQKNIMNTNVVIPGRQFSLAIDLAENTFRAPIKPGKLKAAQSNVRTNGRTGRPPSAISKEKN